MENLITKNGNNLNIEILANDLNKNMRGNWDAEKLIKVNDKTYVLGVHKSYNGRYYAVSHMVEICKSGFTYGWDVEKQYYFDGKIRATKNKVAEIMENATKAFENWLVENY